MKLSEREGQILEQVRKAKNNREIADVLSISEGTVKTHLKNLYRKLGVKSRLEAALHA